MYTRFKSLSAAAATLPQALGPKRKVLLVHKQWLLPTMLLVAACSSQAPPTFPAHASTGTLAEVFSSLVRSKSLAEYSCLSVDDADAPGVVVAILLASGKNVANASECTWPGGKGIGFHSRIRLPATFVNLSGYKQLSETSAEIHFSIYRAALDGSLGRCELLRVNSKWTVSDCIVDGVS